MGNCFSGDGQGGRPVGGAAAAAVAGGPGLKSGADGACDLFLKSRCLRSPYTQIELSLSATDLCDQDVLSKSDSLAIVYAKQRDGKLEELGRTEVILNSANPVWTQKIIINYQFEVLQHLVFQVYDVESVFHNVPAKMLKLEEQQLLGEASSLLSEVVTTPARSLTLNLYRKENNETHLRKLGKLNVCVNESLGSKTIMEIVFRCSELENKDLFSKSDPFLLMSRKEESGVLVPISKTEVKKNDRNPIWRPVIVNLQQIVSKENPLAIECFNFNSNGKHELIGKVIKSLAELEKLHHSQHGEDLFLPTLVGNDYEDKVLKSQIFVERFSQSKSKTFLDYISDGCEMNFMVAIDFTASNGNPRLPDSLHYIDPSGRPNAYQRVEGIQGIMSAYISALHNVSLAGPTLFGHVISAAALIAGQSLSNSRQKYFILLIVTDGVITDLQETKDALVKASDLPLSILIVGVGGADFKEMEILDAEKGERIESPTGRVASRDIVQFVAMRDAQSGEVSVIQSLLAELPRQFMSYMQSRDVDQLN
ncbi:protein BONZAI 1-like isoform X2 [Musa acuminata AAA Group]|uniref:protein BONZAI 1-like isoform X2 n=1 Tax=Musa acuminata AAA Group TaxID=214697 RepID=UPI0031CE847D